MCIQGDVHLTKRVVVFKDSDIGRISSQYTLIAVGGHV